MPLGAIRSRIRPFSQRAPIGAAAFACVLFAGCRPPATLDPLDASPAAPPLAVAVAEAAQAPLPAANTATELLPSDTLAMFEVLTPATALTQFGLPELLTHGGLASQGASMMLDAETRALIENPQKLREYGVDPDGSLGGALLDVGAGAVVGWITLSDERLALDTLEKRSGRRFEFRGSRAGRIAQLGSSDQLVLRDGVLFFVHVDNIDAATHDIARTLSDADPRQSLATAAPFQEAFAVPGADMARAYVAPATLVQSIRSRMMFRQERREGVQQMQLEVDALRDQGADPEAIEHAQREVTIARESAQRRQSRDDKQLAAFETVLGPVRSISARMSASPGKLHAALSARFSGDDALLSRLFAPTGAASHWLKAADHAPHGLLEGGFDPQAAFELVALAAAADGEDFGQFQAEFRSETGFDLKVDFFDQLRGTGAMGAYFAKPPVLTDGRRGEDQMDFAITVAIKDPAHAKTVLAALAKKAKHPSVKRDARTKAYVVEIDKQRKLYLAVVGEQVAATTDLAWLRRLRDGSVGAGASKLRRPELKTAFEQSDPVARGLIDFVWFVYLDARAPYGQSLEDFDRRFEYYRDIGPDRANKVKWGSKLKKKRAQLKRVYAKLQKGETKQRELEVARQAALVRKMGFLSIDGHRVPHGFDGTVDILFEGNTFMTVALDLVDEMQMGPGADDTVVDLRHEMRDLEGQIESERYAEIDRWLAKHGESRGPQGREPLGSTGGFKTP